MSALTCCGTNAITYELDESGQLIPGCLVCGRKFPAADKHPDTGAPLAQTQQELPPKPQPRPLPPAAKKAEPFDVIASAKARLRELNTEIRRLQKLTRERDQLARLLAAAKKTTDQKVTPIRRAS